MRLPALVREHDLIEQANIGECILEERRLTDATEREDVRSIGYIMMELMEPATSFGNSRTIDLKHPEEWKDNTGIKDFLAATQTVSREELCKVRYAFVNVATRLRGSSTGSSLESRG